MGVELPEAITLVLPMSARLRCVALFAAGLQDRF